jgi:tetratricopeptide (TPR) repeat protein
MMVDAKNAVFSMLRLGEVSLTKSKESESFLSSKIDDRKSVDEIEVAIAVNDFEATDICRSTDNLIENGKFQESVDKLISVLQSHPDNQLCNAVLGAVLLALKQYTLAEGFLYSAVKLSNWTDTASVANLAASFRDNNQSELSLKTLVKCREAIKEIAVPGESLAIISEALGDSLSSAGNYSTASELYLEAALLRPHIVTIWVIVSIIHVFPA